MAAFYIDNCLSPKIGTFLRQGGHQAHTARGRGKSHAGDDEQLLLAAENGEILGTANRRDFFLLHDAWLRWALAWRVPVIPTHAGILVIPQTWPPDVAARVLALFVQASVSLASQVHRYIVGAGWVQRQ